MAPASLLKRLEATPTARDAYIAVNTTAKPFNDVRVRKALTLGIDRYTMSKVLAPLTGLKFVGALMRPGSEWAMSDVEIEELQIALAHVQHLEPTGAREGVVQREADEVAAWLAAVYVTPDHRGEGLLDELSAAAAKYHQLRVAHG